MPEPRPPPHAPIRADLDHQRATRRRARMAVAATVALALAAVLVLAGVWLWRYALSDLPRVPEQAALWRLNQPASLVLIDREGRTLGWRGPGRGEVASLADLPPYVPKAFLAAEDRRFYRHMGVDLVGIARAVRANLEARRVVEGGSTITQQIARTLFLSPDQTLRRKLQEAALALQIEQRLPKDEILRLYLNRIYFGAGAYGIEAAAHTYFGKPARRLTLAEAALLAALPKAPSRLAPTNNLEAALERSRLVLANMRSEGWISRAEETHAALTPPELAEDDPGEADFGYVLDFAAGRALELVPTGSPALVVRLSLDSAVQRAAAAEVRKAVRENRARGVTQAAVVVLGPEGAIRALVGGVDHRESAFDRAVQARRQPGSAFKPFVYAAALQAGLKPGDVREDAPIRIGDWAPRNAGGGYAGPVTLADALARSINTIAVRLTQEVGPAKVAALARRFGLAEIPERPQPSVALGAYETTLLHLAEGYQVFQQGGRRSPPYLIEQISTMDGRVLYRRAGVAPAPVYPEALNGQMVRMMRGVIDHGTGRRAALGRPAAGKTGTNQDYRDAWFAGFTPDFVAAVWVGDDRGRPMRQVEGGDVPAVLWREVMLAAHQDLPPHEFAVDAAAAAADARSRFYRTLADDFARVADPEAARSEAPAAEPLP